MPADEITIEGSLEAVICFDSCADRVTVNRFVARPSGTPVLEIRGLNVFYGRSHALQGVDLTLRQGALSVVGRNGMGKTTLFKTLMGILPAKSGAISVAGQDVTRDESFRRGLPGAVGGAGGVAAVAAAEAAACGRPRGSARLELL